MFTSTKIRVAYSYHVLRAQLQGFAPLSLRSFVAVAAII